MKKSIKYFYLLLIAFSPIIADALMTFCFEITSRMTAGNIDLGIYSIRLGERIDAVHNFFYISSILASYLLYKIKCDK